MIEQSNVHVADEREQSSEAALPLKVLERYLDNNEFVIDVRENRFVYSKDFYIAMYKKIHDEHMTYIQAYTALGFDTKVLGENRALSAGKRAVQMANEHKLFTVDPSNYDGSVSMENMGNLNKDEQIAYLKARVAYFEEAVSLQKKILSELTDKRISSNQKI